MICYQLPNGKCVYISVDQLLTMSDADIQDYIAGDHGYSSNNPFKKLPYDKKDKFDEENEDFKEDDNTPDMLSDGDDVGYTFNIDDIDI